MYHIKYLFDVDEFIDKVTVTEQRKIVKNLKYLQEFGIRPEFRDIKKIQGYPFYEVRILGKNNLRIFCYQKNKTIYILNVFSKKTGKTSQRELTLGQKLFDKYI